ncbi:hypothetical protein C1H46_022561 [Malus baccata]|uniref:Uncharacterized protein n=1 Tax=Malus baccata TaxID=106549 RepID=A0A540LZC3_MALBA|nr:hypothetical protein C1H46_022561 [Malus baccata]
MQASLYKKTQKHPNREKLKERERSIREREWPTHPLHPRLSRSLVLLGPPNPHHLHPRLPRRRPRPLRVWRHRHPRIPLQLLPHGWRPRGAPRHNRT